MIYAAVVVYSVLKEDGKYHLKNKLEAFSDEDTAIKFIESEQAFMEPYDTIRFKLGTVHKIEAIE